MSRHSVSPLACWVLESVLPARYREVMLGDLIEEYALRVESTSPSAATHWFWSQACRSVPSMVGSSLRTGDWLLSASIAMGVYIAMGMLKFAADWTIAKLVAPEQTMAVVLAPIVFLTTTAAGGCVAARIRRGATVLLALSVMITVVVLIDLEVCTIPVPWWYQFGFLALGPPTVLITPAVLGVGRPRGEEPAR